MMVKQRRMPVSLDTGYRPVLPPAAPNRAAVVVAAHPPEEDPPGHPAKNPPLRITESAAGAKHAAGQRVDRCPSREENNADACGRPTAMTGSDHDAAGKNVQALPSHDDCQRPDGSRQIAAGNEDCFGQMLAGAIVVQAGDETAPVKNGGKRAGRERTGRPPGKTIPNRSVNRQSISPPSTSARPCLKIGWICFPEIVGGRARTRNAHSH